MEQMRKTAPMEPVWSTISPGQEAKKEILVNPLAFMVLLRYA
jgi:hypothetical protein